MNLAFMLAAVLALSGFGGREAPFRNLGSGPAQAASVPEGNPQAPAQDAAGASGGAEQSAAETEKESPPDKKVEAPSAGNPATGELAPSATKRRSRKKKVAPPTPEGEPRKVVIHHGGASETTTQILPGMSPEEASRQRETSEQLLEASALSLRKLAGRSLDPTQQEMVVQIRQYMDGARSALKERDTQRAHTLALKAYLLADDLAKHEQ